MWCPVAGLGVAVGSMALGAVGCLFGGGGGAACNDSTSITVTGIKSPQTLPLPATMVICPSTQACAVVTLTDVSAADAGACPEAVVNGVCCDLGPSTLGGCWAAPSDGFDVELLYDQGAIGGGFQTVRLTIHKGDAAGPAVYDELRVVLNTQAPGCGGYTLTRASVTFEVPMNP